MTKRQAKGFIERISKRFNLCDKLNGLENTNNLFQISFKNM